MGCLVGIVFMLILMAGSGLAASPKRVLVVHSFGSVAPPFTTHSIAFETELVEKMGERVDLDEVSLDMARNDPSLQEALVDYLQKRQAKWKPDLVVPIGSPAGVFVAQYRDRLFPETPILYTGMDQRRLPSDALEKDAAFIGEEFNIPGFIEDILQVAPETRNIAVVIGASPVEQFWAAAFRKEFEPFANRVNFIWLNELSFDQMLERVRALPPHSYIFLILLLRDAAGVTHNADEALQRIHAVANAPINGIFQHQLGLGIVGGRLYQAELEGIESARTAVRILHGEPASSFPSRVVGPLPPRYDWRELQRWKIPEQQLPKGSAILFRELTVWEQYRWWIIGGSSLCLVQALLIFGLLANLAKRRRAERSLIESEKRFRTMADAAPVMIWMSDQDKLCTFFNQAWLEFTGRTMDQESGNGWAEGVHRDDLEACLRTYQDAFNARQPFVMQYRLLHRSGEYRWITDKGVPRYGPAGTLRGYVGACTDISDLLSKERALHEFEERVTLAAEAAHLGVWELNIVTDSVWVSDKAKELFQFDPDATITHSVLQERVHPNDRELRNAAVRHAIDAKDGYEMEYRILLPNGKIRWIGGRARMVEDEEGKLTRLLGVSMDVTDRKQDQELFRLSTESSPSGMLLVNNAGNILLVNSHIEELFGYQRDELLGRSVEILIPDLTPDTSAAPAGGSFSAQLNQPMVHSREVHARRKDGTNFPIEIGLNPVETPEGSLILATVVDISARKLAEEENRLVRERISRLNRISLLGEMTASIAHEVNQPLSGIISNASAGQRFIDRGDADPGKIREILSDIVTDGRRAHDVVQNIRNTIKKGAALRKKIDLNESVIDVARMVQPDAQAHSCELNISLAKDLPLIDGDPIQIQQVLINLLGNAFDAMRETPVDHRKVDLATERNGQKMIRLIVRDNGPGIANEVRDTAFRTIFHDQGRRSRDGTRNRSLDHRISRGYYHCGKRCRRRRPVRLCLPRKSTALK